ncbi:MAG: bifunctional 4-hydroxy-2-oxoglutarate aldolase/2-dehydro-3-deoxy-phosphogluconate aldolase [Pseudonocardia sp.]|nr:bifunctional 4-hydroxy-2-oxoglutarate aldolase/2-dehydro-3-deoxy-phosphogluconate aldolase [Pseudonocardia sp.]
MIDLLDILSSRKVVAVLRAPDAGRFVPVARVLYDAGFRCIEFTLTTRGAIDALCDVRRALPDDVLLGIGTVRTLQQVEEALEGEADFLVSQTFNPEVIDAAQRSGVPFIPGALTPTEVLRAWEHGVPAVKVSPIGPVGGPEYLTELTAPMPEVPVMPTGGVTVDNGAEYLRRGAVAVGISRSLTGDALTPGGDLDALAQRARTAVSGVAALAAA